MAIAAYFHPTNMTLAQLNEIHQRLEKAGAEPDPHRLHHSCFGGMLKGTTTSISLAHVRPVEPDHAFADAEQTIYAANGDVLMALHVVNLLRKDGDDWQLVDSRPYAFPPPPA
jgi:hypothetical protein